jgi:hypothetical protein
MQTQPDIMNYQYYVVYIMIINLISYRDLYHNFFKEKNNSITNEINRFIQVKLNL